MRIWDQDLLLAKKGIVTNGLTFWIDGRDTVQGTRQEPKLLDRVSGNTYGFVLSKSYIIGEKDENDKDFYWLHRQSDLYGFFGSGVYSASNVNSIEFVAKNSAINTRLLSSYTETTATQGYSYAQLLPARIAVFDGVSTEVGREGVTVNGAHIVINLTGDKKIYRNGEALDLKFTPTISRTITYLLCFHFENKSTSGIKIGAVRTYDHPLTELEIRKNYNFEKSIGRVT